MKPRTQEELEMFFLPTDGTCWDEEQFLEMRQWMEDEAAQKEYNSWLTILDSQTKESRNSPIPSSPSEGVLNEETNGAVTSMPAK
jgi:hypothetical protein